MAVEIEVPNQRMRGSREVAAYPRLGHDRSIPGGYESRIGSLENI